MTCGNRRLVILRIRSSFYTNSLNCAGNLLCLCCLYILSSVSPLISGSLSSISHYFGGTGGLGGVGGLDGASGVDGTNGVGG